MQNNLLSISCAGGTQYIMFGLFAISIILAIRGLKVWKSGSIEGNNPATSKRLPVYQVAPLVWGAILFVVAVIMLIALSNSYKGVTCP